MRIRLVRKSYGDRHGWEAYGRWSFPIGEDATWPVEWAHMRYHWGFDTPDLVFDSDTERDEFDRDVGTAPTGD